jgi:uncharacterized protein (DUF1330 family)
MDAYMIIEAEIHDRERFAAYAQAVAPLVAEFGGEYLVLGGVHVPLEGEFGGQRFVISRWPSREAAERFWHSERYAEIRKLREGTGRFRVILIEGRTVEGKPEAKR